MKYLIPMTLLFTVAAFVGCAEQQQTAETPGEEATPAVVAAVNTHCPIMGSEVTDDGGRVEWNGTTVGFCCPGCIEEFESMSDDEKSEALAKADKKQDGHDHDEHEHEHEHESAEPKAS